MTVNFTRLLALALGVAAPGSAFLAPSLAAQEVVQPLPNPAARDLTEALQRLSRNPGSVPALLSAGRASLELDDVDAALGFFSRAQAVEPGNGAVRAGLALVALRRGDAATALQLFADADAAGYGLAPYAADRGLAFDLVGRNNDAQRLYQLALAEKPDAVVTRRLALSYAIAGDGARSEAVLLPLLQQQDQAAYRTRAFALAILGRGEEAASIAQTMLPAGLSSRLGPYLLYMPRLTRAQQAAAANLGRFPADAEIGQDEPRIARAASNSALSREPQVARVDERLIPQGQMMGQPSPTQVAVQAPVQAPVQIAAQAPVRATPQAPAPAQPAPVAKTVYRPSLTEAFSDFSLPGDLRGAATARAGAVDVTAIQPAREAPRPAPPPPPPPPPAHPSRHWVQIATGQDVSAFRFDWRRLVRRSNGLLEGRDAYRASWGRTNRLVTGPFASAREAQQFVGELAKADIDAFRWNSDEGEEVAKLP